MTEGPWGPTMDQNPAVLSTVQIQSKRDDPFPKELISKHKMEKSHY